jgi:hypothetical protein
MRSVCIGLLFAIAVLAGFSAKAQDTAPAVQGDPSAAEGH